MCTVSAVYDDFNNRVPDIFTTPNWPYPPLQPAPSITLTPVTPLSLAAEIEEMRKLISEFRTAVDLARQLDILMKKPDCVDPEKAKLDDRVAALERRMNEVAKVLPAAKE